jgi:hypothetical protein
MNDNYYFDKDTCIICLESNAVNINDLTILTKTCLCCYNIHTHCIITWTKLNPTCPYCKKKLSFNDTCIIIEPNCSDITPLLTSDSNNIDNNISDSNNESYPENTTCIRTILLAVCVTLVIVITIDNVYMNILS